MKILAVDFGLRNIGLAFSQGQLVEPLAQLKVDNPAQALEKIKKVCLEKEIELVVLGLPEGKLVPLVKDLGRSLQQELAVKVAYQDESLTSQEAVEKMVEAGKPLKKRRQQKDLFAACLILQSFLLKLTSEG